MNRNLIVSFLLVLLLLGTGCAAPRNESQINLNTVSTKKSDGAFDKLIFKFKDASLAPEFQRNYTITVTKEKAGLVVESN